MEMDVANNDKKLLPGMVAEVSMPLAAEDSSFVIPKSAFINSTEKQFVIRISDHKAEWVEVKPGRSSGNFLVIYGNLAPGDQLVQTASEEIRNGSAVGSVKLSSQH